jgi:flagellar FliJ protein
MGFRYPLQKIVDWKHTEKSMAEWAYAAALGNLRHEEERLSRLRREREELARQLEQAVSRPTSLARLNQLQLYLETLDLRIRDQSDGVRRARDVVRQRQMHLTDKVVDEKVWLNAREKAWERFRLEWQRREQHELDDLAAGRAARAARG